MTTPALTHEDASAQLLDLVYGEAAGTTRAALEAHVAGCAQCKADLAALGDTHQLLRGTFEDLPVPARAHARILEAAKAEAAKVAGAPAAAARAPGAAKAPAPSFWERMRGRWTLPTLATVGAVAVVVISSRLFLDPNRAFEQMQERRAPAVAEPPPAAPAPAEGLAAGAPAQGPAADDRAPAPPASADLIQHRRKALEQLRMNPPGGRGAQRPQSIDDRLRSAMERLDSPALRGGGGGVASGSGALGGIAAPRDELAKSAGAKASEAEKADKAAPKPAAAPERSSDGYARPPAGWGADTSSANAAAKKGGAAAPAPAPASAPVAAAPAKRKLKVQQLQKDEEDRDEAPAAGAAAPSAQPSEPMAMEEASRAKSESATASERKERQKEAAPSVEALARKAEQLFTAGRWSEAIAAYRELLRRFPDADPVTQWRSRLVQSQREETAARAKAATKAAPAAQ